ncbi:hypothetical protein GGX14DRAFT_390448 [Mycena pura]|uniref:Uncharacterized protein n=1 Tax=Mycena pura TaxID=153505 RepID=A0AAD6VSC4_9AGAR|nr:hypothetical protein GGX14DRAFT_390448 [Mycena pura]
MLTSRSHALAVSGAPRHKRNWGVMRKVVRALAPRLACNCGYQGMKLPLRGQIIYSIQRREPIISGAAANISLIGSKSTGAPVHSGAPGTVRTQQESPSASWRWACGCGSGLSYPEICRRLAGLQLRGYTTHYITVLYTHPTFMLPPSKLFVHSLSDIRLGTIYERLMLQKIRQRIATGRSPRGYISPSAHVFPLPVRKRRPLSIFLQAVCVPHHGRAISLAA